MSSVPWRIRWRTSSTPIPSLSQMSAAVCVSECGETPGRLSPAAFRQPVDPAADAPRVEPLPRRAVPVRDEERVLGPDAPARVEVEPDRVHHGRVDGDLLVLDGVALALHAEEPAEERLVEVLHVGADEFDLAQPGVEHEVDDRPVALLDGARGAEHVEQLRHLVFGEHLAGVLARAAVALDRPRRVLLQQPDVDEVLAEAADRREVRRDRDLAQLALLHEVASCTAPRPPCGSGSGRRSQGVPPLELVERAPVRPDRLFALPLRYSLTNPPRRDSRSATERTRGGPGSGMRA